jgi:hypothetical protein
MARRTWTTTLALAAAMAGVAAPPAMAQSAGGKPAGSTSGAPHACSLLTAPEIEKLINRGQPTYGQVPEAMSVTGGTLCEYPAGGQVFVFGGPRSAENLETLLKNFKQDKEKRQPVAKVGDRAWIMFPTPRSRYQDKVAFLVAQRGQYTVAVSLAAQESAYSGPAKEYCESGQMKASDCDKLKASPSETPESLQPAVTELARTVIARLP